MVQSIGMNPAFVKIENSDSYINANSIQRITKRGSKQNNRQVTYGITYAQTTDNGTQRLSQGEISEKSFKQLNVLG